MVKRRAGTTNWRPLGMAAVAVVLIVAIFHDNIVLAAIMIAAVGAFLAWAVSHGDVFGAGKPDTGLDSSTAMTGLLIAGIAFADTSPGHSEPTDSVTDMGSIGIGGFD